MPEHNVAPVTNEDLSRQVTALSDNYTRLTVITTAQNEKLVVLATQAKDVPEKLERIINMQIEQARGGQVQLEHGRQIEVLFKAQDGADKKLEGIRGKQSRFTGGLAVVVFVITIAGGYSGMTIGTVLSQFNKIQDALNNLQNDVNLLKFRINEPSAYANKGAEK